MMKTCPECGGNIVGRSDKKFCSDGCRNTYNNKQNSDSSNFMRRVNNQLRKNHRILLSQNEEGKTKISKTKLLSLGFDFDYITQKVTYKNGAEYQFVYDQGYKYLDEDLLLLVRLQKD